MITVAYLRLMGDDVRCVRCRAVYRQVAPQSGARMGQDWYHCPRCEAELRDPPPPAWADTLARTVLGAGLLLAAAASMALVLL